MDKGFLEDLQQIAQERYDAVEEGKSAEAIWHANIILAEIAVQLAKLNETLSDMAKDMAAVQLSDLG